MQWQTWFLCGLVAAMVAVSTTGALADEPTSQTNQNLRKWLEKFPEADANHDGILTASEAWAWLHATTQRQLEKRREALKNHKAPLPAPPPLPKPDQENVKYGPYGRNVLDFWQAHSTKPAPLLVYIHGGGWMQGDKRTIALPVLTDCLKAGISVAAINYRYTTTAILPAPQKDGARAIQFLRSKAKEWNIDPARVAAYGGSAGAGITLWLAFHDDMADPKSEDPISRQSTRLCCAATFGGQTSYDPHVIKEWIGDVPAHHPVLLTAYGVNTYADLDNPKLQPLYDEVSAIKHLTADDPPVFEVYSEPAVRTTPNCTPEQGMHSPIFGLKLKEAMDKFGIECIYFHTVENSTNPNTEMVKFFRRHFGLK